MPARGYYIKIVEHDGGYMFQMWYIAKQEMGYSQRYNTKKECLIGVETFKKYLREISPTEENGLAKVKQLDNGKFVYEIYSQDGDVLYYSRNIQTKYNCRKSLRKTCEKFGDAEIR